MKSTPHKPVVRTLQWHEERARASRHTLSAALRVLRRRLLHPLLRCYWLACAILCEIRSCFGHIRVLLAKRLDRSGVPVVGETPATLHPVSRKYTNACTADTRFVVAILPAASLVDLYLFGMGWERGAEWGLRMAESGQGNTDSCKEQTAADTQCTSVKASPQIFG